LVSHASEKKTGLLITMLSVIIVLLVKCPCVATAYKLFNKTIVHNDYMVTNTYIIIETYIIIGLSIS
jgi:hypothetical protein